MEDLLVPLFEMLCVSIESCGWSHHDMPLTAPSLNAMLLDWETADGPTMGVL